MTRVSLLSLLLLVACASDPEPGRAPKSQSSPDGLREPGEDELRELKAHSKAILVGSVEERVEDAGDVIYVVRVKEVLALDADIKGSSSHPLKRGELIRVDEFVFREKVNAPKEVGRLSELTRYVFFLRPKDQEGLWFNMDDAAGYPLPEAQATVKALKALEPPNEE